MNYFQLLNIPQAFSLDIAALEKSYFAAQRACHPDRFVGKPAAERQAALQRSVDVNDAYSTLKNPLSRAEYLLHLHGIVVGTDADTVKPSQELLMEVIDIRENQPSEQALADLRNDSIARIGALFLANDFQAMAQQTLRLRYLMKARHESSANT